jgi:Spy/CpxP family protein refolding chaperone
MGRDSLKIALILSLAFNLAVVGAFAYGYARRPAQGVFCPPSGGIAPEDSFGGRCSRFARQIGIPRERAVRFSHVMADSSGGMRELRVNLQKARGELVDLMGASQIDEKAIMAKVDEIAAIQGQLEKKLITRLLGVSSTLEPRERERFMREIRFRCMPFDRGVPKGPRGAREEREVER